MGRPSLPAEGPKDILVKRVPTDVYNAARDAANLTGQTIRDWMIDAIRDRAGSSTDVMNTSRVAYASSVITSGSSMGSWVDTPTYSQVLTSVAHATSPQIASAIDMLSGKALPCAAITTTAAVGTITVAATPTTTTGPASSSTSQ